MVCAYLWVWYGIKSPCLVPRDGMTASSGVKLLPLNFNGSFNFIYSDGKRTSKVEIWPAVKTSQLSNELQIAYLKLTINGQSANGVLIRKSDVVETSEEICDTWTNWTMTISQNPTEESIHTCKQIPERNICVQDEHDGENYDAPKFAEFSQQSCKKVLLVGGKGASLAKLQTFTLTHPSSQVMSITIYT